MKDRSLSSEVREAHQTLHDFLSSPNSAPVQLPADPNDKLDFICRNMTTKTDLNKFLELFTHEITSVVKREVAPVQQDVEALTDRVAKLEITDDDAYKRVVFYWFSDK